MLRESMHGYLRVFPTNVRGVPVLEGRDLIAIRTSSDKKFSCCWQTARRICANAMAWL